MKKVFLTVCVLSVMFCSMGLSAQDWYEKIKISGDFRNRFEYISDDTVRNGATAAVPATATTAAIPANAGVVVKRYRERIRLRLGASAEVAKDLKVGFRFATGESSDPISTNQSLTTGFSKKGVTLDLAFAEYKASENSSLSGLNVIVGKMNNPFFKPGGTDLIWDNDLTPEGVSASYSHSIGDKFNIKALLGGFWVEERAKAADSGMLAAELIATFKPMEKLSLDLGLSYFNYGNAKNALPFFDATKGFGNTTYSTGVAPATTPIAYKGDFDVLDIGFQATYVFDFAPVSFFAEYVTNSGAEKNTAGDKLNNGFLFGFSLGKISGPKTWMFSYSYRQLKADATVGAFADADISGGGTNIKGSRIAAEYAIYKSWIVGATVFVGSKNIATSSDKYTRVQLDMNFKF